MASRGSLNVLDPSALNRLHDAAQPPLKKRKISSVSDERACENIVIREKAHAASLSDEPYVLEPVAIISRFRLPFEWLDIPSALSQIQPGSLFVAHIPALETDSQSEPIVLAARLVSDGGLYVIERVKRGIYALSKLARGVEEGDVRVLVKASSHLPGVGLGGQFTPCKAGDDSDGDWWRFAQVEDPVSDLNTPPPVKRAKIDLVFAAPSDNVHYDDEHQSKVSPDNAEDRSSDCDVHVVSALPESQGVVEPSVAREVGEEDSNKTLHSPQELLDGLREQYLQALYVSKASVAYFAKGPLARCRAAFQSLGSGPNKTSDLIGFYREAILTAKKMDLKYRETLPATVHDVILSVSDDNEKVVPKKRKSRKKTLGRNGLYSEEQDFIRRWWKNRSLAENGASIEISREAEIKKHVSDLRLRETLLQILLILETMALEAAAADEAKKASDQGETPADIAPQKSKPKAKKSQDLNVMLELHIDRLCIWHAVSLDDTPVSDVQVSGGNIKSGKAAGSDAMRDFATEVIIPFYASRLPDRCKLITRKLGVSVGTISPFSKSSAKKPRKESSASKRSSSQKQPRRPLQRVLTDEQTTPQGRAPPWLNRSTTAPSQIESKRESSNPLLPLPGTSVRGGIQKAKRVENREVDLIAVARQHETKLKRVQMLAEQKKELDAAILALRKPNRELVAKDIANDVDRRLTTSSSSRKPKNPVRNPLGQGVQVMATPKGSRKRDAVIGLPPLPKSIARPSSKPKATSTSFSSPFDTEPHVIPGSVIRPSSFSGTSRSADVGAVQETPCRRPPQPDSFKDAAEPTTVAESPCVPGKGNLFLVPRLPDRRPTETDPCTPVRSRQVGAADSSQDRRLPPPPPPLFSLSKAIPPSDPMHSSAVFETPPKPTPFSAPAADRRPSGSGLTVTKPASVVPVTPEKSIYAQLGWDDDDDIAF